jgi:hypothetical protein
MPLNVSKIIVPRPLPLRVRSHFSFFFLLSSSSFYFTYSFVFLSLFPSFLLYLAYSGGGCVGALGQVHPAGGSRPAGWPLRAQGRCLAAQASASGLFLWRDCSGLGSHDAVSGHGHEPRAARASGDGSGGGRRGTKLGQGQGFLLLLLLLLAGFKARAMVILPKLSFSFFCVCSPFSDWNQKVLLWP